MANFFPVNVPEYNRISDDDSLMVQAAKRAAQQRQLDNAGINPAAGFNAGDYSVQLPGYKPQGLPLPSAQGVMPQQQAPQAQAPQYRFDAGDYRMDLPAYRPQGIAERIMNFPQVQQAVQSNQQDTLDMLRRYWDLQGAAPQQRGTQDTPWGAIGEIARAYLMSRERE